MKKRLLRAIAFEFLRIGLWLNSRAAGVRLFPLPEPATAPAVRYPPIIVDDDTPIDFSWMPQEWQRLAVGSLSILAPMRQRRALA
jgi:hypothetical protein